MQNVFSLTEQTTKILAQQDKANAEEIKSFITEHPYVEPVFTAAFAQLKQYFPNAQLFPKVVTDSEIATDIHLFIYISPSLDEAPTDVLNKLKEFKEAWGYDAVKQAKGKIAFTPRYL